MHGFNLSVHNFHFGIVALKEHALGIQFLVHCWKWHVFCLLA